MKKISIDKDAIGVEVSWSFGDGDAEAVTLPRGMVKTVFEEGGFDPAEVLPDIDVGFAMKRIYKYAKQSRRIVVRELARPKKDTPRAYGIYKRVEKDESGDGWLCGARVRYQGGTVVCLPPEGDVACLPDCEEVGVRMARMANTLLDSIHNLDLSKALTRSGNKLGWISRRRNSGGVYFVPAGTGAEEFVQVLKRLEGLTQNQKRKNRFIPQIQEVYPKPLTMASWAGSAEDNFQGEIDKLHRDLERCKLDGKMREKTVLARAEECDRIIGQAEHYRVFLAEKVDDLARKLGDIRDAFRGTLQESSVAAEEALGAAADAAEAGGVSSEPAAQEEAPTPKRRKRRGRKVRKKLEAETDALFEDF